MGTAVIIVGLALVVLAATLAPLHYRMKDRARLYDLLIRAQEHGQPLPPDIVRQLASNPSSTREKDIRRGAILLAIAVGLSLPIALTGGIESLGVETAGQLLLLLTITGSCTLGVLGLALLVLGLMQRRPEKD